MSNYRRPPRSDAPVFFTVALADRRSDVLVAEIERLRAAVRVTRAERPFGIEAWVVLPDHMHCIWRVPGGGLCAALAADQGAVLAGLADGGAAAKPHRARRARTLAAPVLGASYPRRNRPRGASALLLVQPGEAWPGHAPRGLAVFVRPSRNQRAEMGVVRCVFTSTFAAFGEMVRASTHPTGVLPSTARSAGRGGSGRVRVHTHLCGEKGIGECEHALCTPYYSSN